MANSDSDSSYDPQGADMDYYSELEFDAEGVSDDEVEPVGETDPFGFRFVTPLNLRNSDKHQVPLPAFVGEETKATDAMPKFGHPVEAFKAFMDYEVASHIIDCTNERAQIFLGDNPKKIINGIQWKPLNMDTFHVFIGLVLLIGIVRLPRLHMYWSDHILVGGPPIFCAKVMSRNMFQNILKFLRFSKREEVRPRTPKTRLESFLRLLRKKCKDNVHIGQHIAIDESLMLYKGRLFFKQFIKTKRARFGIKILFVCPGHPDWQGFSWDFEIYYGAGTEYSVDDDPDLEEDDPRGSELTKSEAIVVYLMQGLLGQDRHVIVDNWYASLRLAIYLLYKGTTMTGVVRSDRGVPQLLKDDPLGNKASSFVRRGNVLITKFQDRKPVYSITTRYVHQCL